MARRWVVLTAVRASGRGAGAVNEIIEYTERASRTAAADEVIYTDPVDSNGDPVDKRWQIGGTVTLSGGVYSYTPPAGQGAQDDRTTDVGRIRAAVRDADEQFDLWYVGLVVEGVGQPTETRDLGQDLLLGGRKALYVTSHNTAIAASVRIAIAQGLAQGASDVASVFAFYTRASGLTVPSSYVPGNPLSWAAVSGTTVTRRTLAAAMAAAANDFTAANLRTLGAVNFGRKAWIETITA